MRSSRVRWLLLPMAAALLAVGWMVGQWNAGRGGGTSGLVFAQGEASEGEIVRAARLVSPSVVSIRSGTGRSRGSGTGFIVRSDGLILTNDHVVAGNSEVTVTLADGMKRYTGRVIGTDPDVDTALVKIDARGLPEAPLGDSDQVQVGQTAIAIGNPLGYLTGTVTVGVVSGRNRRIGGRSSEMDNLIQTDAAINPGNSGGPLLDSHGRVIGINNAVVQPPYGGGGLGFAVPINSAHDVMESLLRNGRVERPWLGIEYQEITPEVASELNLKVTEGARVAQVVPDSPAARAGLQTDDIIVRVDGRPLSSGNLRAALRHAGIGKALPLEVQRGSRRLTVTPRPTDEPRGS